MKPETNPGTEAAARQPARVKALFDGIAQHYDLINDLQSLGLHRRWKRWLVTLAQPQPGDWALDVCCGTGDIAFELARRGVAVVGVDFSQAMLQAAQTRTERLCGHSAPTKANPAPEAKPGRAAGVTQTPPRRCPDPTGPRPLGVNCPGFVQADALRLPFLDRSFAIVTIGYGLRNLADWQAGLAELWRVLRPGGRLLVLEFGKPACAVWRTVYFAYLRWLVPLLGRWIARNAPGYRYILESLESYPAQRGVAAVLSRMPGVEAVRLWELLGGAMSIHWARKAG